MLIGLLGVVFFEVFDVLVVIGDPGLQSASNLFQLSDVAILVNLLFWQQSFAFR